MTIKMPTTTTDPSESEAISRIADKGLLLLNGLGANTDKISVVMDLEFTHAEIPMDLDKLESFDDFNFAHDIVGIYKHFNRRTYKMDDFFLPRCSR